MKRALVLLAIAAAAAAGCEEDKGTPPAPSGDQVIADGDLAVPADFAEEAEKAITPANYKAELDTLEKEISAE